MKGIQFQTNTKYLCFIHAVEEAVRIRAVPAIDAARRMIYATTKREDEIVCGTCVIEEERRACYAKEVTD